MLRKTFQIEIERFASPLNCSVQTVSYYSKFESDSVFGANLDAFSRPWTGSSAIGSMYSIDGTADDDEIGGYTARAERAWLRPPSI